MKISIPNGFSVSKFVIEVVAIIFGVLLALGVNEIRQHYKDKALVDTALESITLEIENNKAFLDRRIPYYQSMVDTLDMLIKEHGSEVVLGEVKIPGFFGINPPMLRNSSLQTASSTQAFSNMDYSLSDKIFWVYSFQETYLKWVYIYLDAFTKREKQKLKLVQNLFKEMAFVGSQVNEDYQRLLEELAQM